ncbi:MAG: hypothetical protein GX783_05620 [Clostridiales bacterium]|jgi:hypothetical protein|nr:hypothetical protein [Clostridiales bacterium]
MILNFQEAERFYKIYWSLLAYVNDKFNISSEFKTQLENGKVLAGTAVPIREKLWADNSLLESFVFENPARHADDELSIAASWRHRIAGTFFIYKYLKKYTIFIDDKTPPKAYGVHGIIDPIEDIVTAALPVLTKAVLLPFNEKIVHDGILSRYNMSFGSGYRSNLKFAYRDAKEREGIISSLIPQSHVSTTEQIKKGALERNNLIFKAFSKHLSKSGLSVKMVQQHTANIETFANSYLVNLDLPQALLDIEYVHLVDYLNEVLIELKVKKTNIISFKRFIRFLNETGRLHPEDYWDMYDFLKEYKY